MDHTQFRGEGSSGPPTAVGLHVYQLNMRKDSMCLVLLTHHLSVHSADVLLLQDPPEGLAFGEECPAGYELYLPSTDSTTQTCPAPPLRSHPREVYIEGTGHSFSTPPCLWYFYLYSPSTPGVGVRLYPLY